MPAPKLILRDHALQITNLEIRHRDVVDFFESVPEEEREARFIHAVELGVFCLQRSTLHLDADFYKRQIEGLLDQVESRLAALPKATQEELTKKIGTGDGQVLAPIQEHVNTVVRLSRREITDVRKLLDNKLDPDSRRSTLGKALQQIQQMLSPKNEDSVQSRLEEAVSDVTRHDGALVRAVRKVVKDVTAPLEKDVKQLSAELRAEEKAEGVRQQTPLKGPDFEAELISELDSWKGIAGAEIDHVGPDKKPGDILVTFAAGTALERSFAIVIEAKADAVGAGRKPIKDAVDRAMECRRAEAAVYVTKTSDGLAREIGEWSEGTSARGSFVACTRDHLRTALRFLIVQRRIEEIRAVLPEVDAATILSEIHRVRTALRKITTINTQVTAVVKGADTIRTQAEALRIEIQEALSNVERSIQLVRATEQPKKFAARA